MNYQVFISRKHLDAGRRETGEVRMARELHAHLTDLGVSTFLDDVSLTEQATARYKSAIDSALDEAGILVAVGTSRENLESEWVRYEWDGFFNDIISGIKPKGQVVSLIAGIRPDQLPRALRQTQAFDYRDDGIAKIGRFIASVLGLEPVMQSRSRRDGPEKRVGKMDTGVLFIDIHQSTKLFKDLGEEMASRIIGKAIRDWQKIAQYHGGWAIKDLGDEIMCGFETADDCVAAAIEIREEIAIGLRGESTPVRIRTGLAFGDAIRSDDGEVYGQAVNVAARMAGEAQPDQVVIDHMTVERLSPDLRERCHRFGETALKDSDEPIVVFEVK